MTSKPSSPLPPIVNRPHDQSEPAATEKNPLLHSRGLILGLLFGVTGALGLPLLWYSPVFGRNEKWLWSLVNIIYTLALILVAFGAIWFAWSKSTSAY